MKRIVPEFHRPLEIARVPPGGSVETVTAAPEERAALARRFALPSIAALSATLDVQQWRRSGARIAGSLRAEIEQTCVVTLENFTAAVREPVERYYLPPGVSTGAADEDEADEIVGGVVDMGELVAETLALAIDPYPRKPGAEFRADAEPQGPAPASPFAALTKTGGKGV